MLDLFVPSSDPTETTKTCDLSVQVVLSASHLLNDDDLRRFALGLSPHWHSECNQLLHSTIFNLSEKNENRSHVVLILDKVGLVAFLSETTFCV